MLNGVILEHIAEEDFDTFDFADNSMREYCGYHRAKHVQMVVQLTEQRFAHETAYGWRDVEDFIHGLNHIFFNGVAAGQTFEWSKERG